MCVYIIYVCVCLGFFIWFFFVVVFNCRMLVAMKMFLYFAEIKDCHARLEKILSNLKASHSCDHYSLFFSPLVLVKLCFRISLNLQRSLCHSPNVNFENIYEFYYNGEIIHLTYPCIFCSL